MSRLPILITCTAFILGILSQEYGNFGLIWKVPPILLGILLLIFNFKNLRDIGILILFWGIGSLAHSLNRNIPPEVEWKNNQNITFILEKKLNSNEKNKRYEILILPQNIKAVASIPKDQTELNFTQFYNADAFINKTEAPKHSYQFNYQKYLRRRDIFHQVYIYDDIKSTEKQQLKLHEKIKQYRLSILQKIDSSKHITLKNKSFLKGIILADRTEIDSETMATFTQTGLVHILAISGAHIALIFLSLNFILGKILPKKWSTIFCLAFIWAFIVFIGFGNSVVRAGIMLSIYHIYTILQRRPNMLHTLSLSALIILIFNSNEIFDIGFQLSFIAVFGIFWLNPPILSLLPRINNNIYNYFITLFSTTISAQLATLPVLLLNFNQFPLLSFITNLIILWFAQAIIIISFFITLLYSVGLNFDYIQIFYNKICSYFLESVRYFSQFDNFLLQNIPMSIGESIILFVIIFQLRFLILKPKLQNYIRIFFSVILFLFLRTILDYHWYQKEEILTHELQKKVILSIKKQNKLIFYLPKNTDKRKIIKYIISPYMNHSRTSNFEIIDIPENTKILKINNIEYPLKQN